MHIIRQHGLWDSSPRHRSKWVHMNELRRLVLLRLIYSRPSLHHFATQGVLLPVVVLGYVASPVPACGFVRIFD